MWRNLRLAQVFSRALSNLFSVRPSHHSLHGPSRRQFRFREYDWLVESWKVVSSSLSFFQFKQDHRIPAVLVERVLTGWVWAGRALIIRHAGCGWSTWPTKRRWLEGDIPGLCWGLGRFRCEWGLGLEWGLGV